MGYRVIEYFTDLQDFNHPYKVGDTFPRLGLDVSKERIAELSTNKNRRKKPLIKKVDDFVVDGEKIGEVKEDVIEITKKISLQKRKSTVCQHLTLKTWQNSMELTMPRK